MRVLVRLRTNEIYYQGIKKKKNNTWSEHSDVKYTSYNSALYSVVCNDGSTYRFPIDLIEKVQEFLR